MQELPPSVSCYRRSAHPSRGAGRLTILLFGALSAAVLYAGYSIAPFYYSYYEIKNQMASVIRVAGTEQDDEIRRRLWYHVKKLELPVEPSDLQIEREDRFMRISLPYKEVFYITWKGKPRDLYVFDFHAYAEGEF